MKSKVLTGIVHLAAAKYIFHHLKGTFDFQLALGCQIEGSFDLVG